jgi:hypothetical protein
VFDRENAVAGRSYPCVFHQEKIQFTVASRSIEESGNASLTENDNGDLRKKTAVIGILTSGATDGQQRGCSKIAAPDWRHADVRYYSVRIATLNTAYPQSAAPHKMTSPITIFRI